jgi:hypothetical protein
MYIAINQECIHSFADKCTPIDDLFIEILRWDPSQDWTDQPVFLTGFRSEAAQTGMDTGRATEGLPGLLGNAPCSRRDRIRSRSRNYINNARQSLIYMDNLGTLMCNVHLSSIGSQLFHSLSSI